MQRWYKVVSPLLKSYYGTGGKLNVDEILEVNPYTEECGVWQHSGRNENRFSFEEIRKLFFNKDGNKLIAENIFPFEEINQKIWTIGADIFALCAASRLVTKIQLDNLISSGLEVISSSAVVPFADAGIFFGRIQK